ncbi:MAG: hypothetical protein GY870_11470 [archaeon]|nr:hypothetical protein [archaeon]
MTEINSQKGNGIFGKWISDEFGLPAYNYTLNQTLEDPGIAYLEKKKQHRRRNWHLIGNDNTIALAVNNNSIQVFAGERGAKYLNEFNPSSKGYTGGFGFIKDGNSKWSMFYAPKDGVNYTERIFGMGYFKKTAEYNNLKVTENVFTPFGSDPLFYIRVTIKNESEVEKNISYYHYWDVLYTNIVLGGNIINNMGKMSGFHLNICPIKEENGKTSGLYTEPRYKRWYRKRPAREEASPEDFYPPVVFLKCLDGEIDAFETKKSNFFISKKIELGESPEWGDILSSESLLKSRGGEQKGLMVLEKKIQLKPGEEKVINFVYGYKYLQEKELDDQQIQTSINFLIKKAIGNDSLTTILEKSNQAWDKYSMDFSGDFDKVISREQKWHSYYTRALGNYTEYFDNYTIQQGGCYTYLWGQNIALRDPLQHAMPMVYLYPKLAKEVLLYTLKTLPEDTMELTYGVSGHGFRTRMIFIPSDAELYVLLLVAEYILATRDFEFLNDEIPYYPLSSGKSSTVKERLIRCTEHLICDIGVGSHQLIRMIQGDWNDTIVLPDNWKTLFSVIKYGESTLNTAIGCYAVERMAELFRAIDGKDSQFSKGLINFRDILRKALSNEWNGRWFNRGYVGNGDILGEDQMYISLQPWAILGGVTDDQQKEILVENLWKYLSSPSETGALASAKPDEIDAGKNIDRTEDDLSHAEDLIWYSLNMWLIYAYSKVKPEYAWEEYWRMHLANRAEYSPGVWEAILSSADSFKPNNSLYPARCQGLMEESPVMVAHSCAVPNFSTIKILGIEPTEDGFHIAPKIPKKGEFRLKTALIELERTGNKVIGSYKNYYSNSGKIQITLDLEECLPNFKEESFNKNVVDVKVNKKEVSTSIGKNTVIFELNFMEIGEKIGFEIEYNGGDL